MGDFPGGPVVRTLLLLQGHMGSIPSWNKILHAMWQGPPKWILSDLRVIKTIRGRLYARERREAHRGSWNHLESWFCQWLVERSRTTCLTPLGLSFMFHKRRDGTRSLPARSPGWLRNEKKKSPARPSRWCLTPLSQLWRSHWKPW